MGPIHTFDDLVDMLRRRVRFMFVVSALGALFSVLFALSQQHLYQATEVIQIARPKIDNDLARSTVAGSSARRLQLIEQRLMARASLLEIIDAFNLYVEYPDLKPSEMVARLRAAVRIDGVAAAREGFADDGTIAVLSITAELPIALQAQQVAHELTRRTIELSRNSRIEQARDTLAFFTTQEEDLTRKMHVLEDQIAAFRVQNDLTLTGSIEFSRAEIATLNQALLDIDREIIQINRNADQVDQGARQATARRMLAGFNQQLMTLEAQRKLLQDRKNVLAASLETSPEIERELGGYERQLRQLRGEMDVISAHRTEAEVGFRLENGRQAERLTVIEPAIVPDYPVTSSRKRTAILGGGLSLMLAFALAFLLELRRPVIRSAAQMKREIGFGPVVSIPTLDASPPKITLWQRLVSLGRGPRAVRA
ncbi:MAG: DUF874 domain-containing protein [Rhodobacteraceae bacterium]|nr:DUF874 domain-containing protein [Paracoccaceae bacterium]